MPPSLRTPTPLAGWLLSEAGISSLFAICSWDSFLSAVFFNDWLILSLSTLDELHEGKSLASFIQLVFS